MEFTLGRFSIDVAVDFGPRVTGLRLDNGPNVLAVLSPDVVVGGEGDSYRFMGGHRVWASPEIPDITYAPDDHECSVSAADGSVLVSGPEDRAGIVKEISATVQGQTLEVESRLLFTRDLDRRFAAWSITQFPQGGSAIVPLAGDDSGPLPNRRLVLWPYTSLADSRLDLSDGFALIDASGDDPIKLGIGPSPGHLGYWRDGLLFVKSVEDAGSRDIPDMGANAQVYVGNGFCELESVGERVPAAEGAVATVVELWDILECPDPTDAIEMTVRGPAR